MARYWDVDYEYVGYDKSWDDMQQMLEDGEIDMVTSPSKTPEREEKFDFSRPIGTNNGILTVRSDNSTIVDGNYSTYNGMRVALFNGSSEIKSFADFAGNKGFTYDPFYFDTTAEMEEALQSGNVDAIAASSLRKTNNERIVDKFDSSDFYVMVKKGNTELLNEINYAIDQMNAVEGDWKTTLYNKNYESIETKNLEGILRERRFKRGSIDFDFPESKIILDEKGKPVEIKEYERNNANRIIEEFMLAANQTVAEEYFWQELPFVYRVHEEPDEEKINKLGVFIENFGYTLKVNSDGEIHPKEIQKLIKSVEGKPEEALISRLALRSMKQAKYMTQCGGHFGLSMKYYCHFTSPIRRYPDLQIHRIIKENIHGQMNDKRIGHYNQILPEVAEAASRLERRADDAEREVEKLKKAEYMEQFIGQSFDGIISGVTTWGMYVELPNTVEGMVRVADIPGDYYYFEEEKYRMVGEHTGKSYKLGEPIRITVSAVDKLTKTIDFTVCEDYELSDGDSENADGNIGDKIIKNKESDNSSLVSGDEKEPESRENERKSAKSQSRRVVEKSDSESLRSSEREKTAKGKKRRNVEKSDSSANGHRRKTSKSSESRSRRDSERKSKAVSKPKNKAAARAKQKAVMEAKEKALKAFEYRKKKAKKKAAKAAAEAKIEHEVKKLTGAAKKRALNKAKKKAKKKAKQAKKLKK